MPRRSCGWGLALVCLVAAVVVHAESVSLLPSADTALLELQPDFNLGIQEDVPAGTLGVAASETRSRILLKFDLAAELPSDAHLTGARLQLVVTRVPDGGGTPSRFGLHRLLRPWNEGERKGGLPGGARAAAGDVTWNSRDFPDVPWDQPGGAAGTDFVADASSSERIEGLGTYEFEFGSNQLLELQQWLEDPASNHGWILISEAEDQPRSARRFGTRDHANPAVRPVLDLDFDAGPPFEPPVITAISIEGSEVHVIVAGRRSIRYGLESSDTFAAPTWQPLGTSIQAAADGPVTLVDDSGLILHRMYRVVAQP